MAAAHALASNNLWNALGHDLRRQLVGLLARSDRRVNELVQAVGERQNLVSYHLGLLKESGLVEERRSAADARDIYYHLDLDRLRSGLNQAATTLHPVLRGKAESQPTEVRARVRPVRVLFICTGNSARSQIAEAILRRHGADKVEVHSAGTEPTFVHPLAVEVLSELGFQTQNLRSKAVDEIVGVDFDYVITLCDIARESCPPIPRKPEFVHWSIADPATISGSIARRRAAFRSTANDIADRVRQFLELIAAQ